VRYGRSVPISEGFLPVFSVDTEEEAQRLLTLTCPVNMAGEFVAPELAREQTLENLEAFSDRLQRGWDLMQRNKKGGS
jgi:hypothetical protein